jgi:5-methylcytosine-specific restriction endonuclease McrA
VQNRGEDAMRNDVPLILSLDNHGIPHRWITWQRACFYHAKDLIAWTLGEREFTFYGGISRHTGKRSSITARSIIAIKGRPLASGGYRQIPPLCNRELFRRDHHMCAYCGGQFGLPKLTRDHIKPVSHGGLDVWMNVVTACRNCNGLKRNRTLEEAGLELLYAPYAPNKAEYLILTNRKILVDQMEFLKQHVAAHSRALELTGEPV